MNLLCRGRCYTWGKMDELQTLRELDSHTPNKNFSQGTIWLSVLVFLRVRQLRIDAVSSRKVKTYERRTWRFIYPSVLTKKPLYSSPHFRRTNTGFPVSSCKNGFGFTGLTCGIREQCRTSKWRNSQQPWWLRKARADFEKKVTTINLVYISCMTIRFYSLNIAHLCAPHRLKNVGSWRSLRSASNRWRPFLAKGYRRQDDCRYVHLHSTESIVWSIAISFPELLPSDVVCAKETRDLVIECCVGKHFSNCISVAWATSKITHLSIPFAEFIHLISSEANEICEQESKKTIAPEHIINALKVRIHLWPI